MERIRMKCFKCNKVFLCTLHCQHTQKDKDYFFDKQKNDPYYIPTCLCWDCDGARKSWKEKCGKRIPFGWKQKI